MSFWCWERLDSEVRVSKFPLHDSLMKFDTPNVHPNISKQQKYILLVLGLLAMISVIFTLKINRIRRVQEMASPQVICSHRLWFVTEWLTVPGKCRNTFRSARAKTLLRMLSEKSGTHYSACQRGILFWPRDMTLSLGHYDKLHTVQAYQFLLYRHLEVGPKFMVLLTMK